LYLVYDCKLTDRPERSKNKRYHMGVLAKNFKGYQNLTKLVSDAHTLGFFTRPRTDMEQLALHAEGLIGFTGCMQGVVPQFILAGEMEKAREALGRFVDIFGKENYFVEIMDHGLPEQQQLIQPLLRLAEEFGLKVVATNDVHYVDQCHNTAHDAMVCIQTGAKLTDEKRMRYTSRQFYLKSQAEMLRIFGERPDAISNTVLVAEMCDVKLQLSRLSPGILHRGPAASQVRSNPRRLCGVEKFAQRPRRQARRLRSLRL
jgi:DNA polymerase III subunit alpha